MVTSLLLDRAAKFTEHVLHIINAFEQGRILITQHMHHSCDQESRHCHLKRKLGWATGELQGHTCEIL